MFPPTKTVIVATAEQIMSRASAKLALNQAKEGLRNARLALLDLHEQRGYRQLGYATWEEFVCAEFTQSSRHVYRLLAAARIERELAGSAKGPGTGNIPETVLRELSRADSKAMRREIWEEANADGPATSDKVRELIELARAGSDTATIDDGAGEGSSPPASPADSSSRGEDLPVPDKIISECEYLRRLHHKLGERRKLADAALDKYLEATGVTS